MRSKHQGFTLIELMVTVTIAAILLVVAVPSFSEMSNKRALVAQLTNIGGALRFARNEAVTRSVNIVACASSDGLTCTASNNWEGGWIVFIDNDSNGSADSLATSTCDIDEDCLLQTYQAMATGVSLAANTAALTFNSYGELAGSAASFALCRQDAEVGSDTNKSHTLLVNASGGIRVAKGGVCS